MTTKILEGKSVPQKEMVIALDLEGTLICDQIDPFPRPGLETFLNKCRLLGRVVVMTTVPEAIFRKIAERLVFDGDAPAWFSKIDYIEWERPYKDLRKIPGVDLRNCFLIDDYEGYVHPSQSDRWVKIETYFDQGDEDSELERVCGYIS